MFTHRFLFFCLILQKFVFVGGFCWQKKASKVPAKKSPLLTARKKKKTLQEKLDADKSFPTGGNTSSYVLFCLFRGFQGGLFDDSDRSRPLRRHDCTI